MKKSWRSTIGGAFSAAGSLMVGIGVVPQLGGTPNKLLSYIALAGFIFNVIGTFLGHLFAADAQELRNMQASMMEVPHAIDSGDTTVLARTIIQPKTPKDLVDGPGGKPKD